MTSSSARPAAGVAGLAAKNAEVSDTAGARGGVGCGCGVGVGAGLSWMVGCRLAGWSGTAVIPLEPGVRRGNRLIGGADAADPLRFTGCRSGCGSAGSGAASRAGIALASLALGDDTAPNRRGGPAANTLAPSSTAGG